jgi:hypothetical protein
MKGRWRRKCPCALAWAWLAAGRRARIFWAPPDTGFARDCIIGRRSDYLEPYCDLLTSLLDVFNLWHPNQYIYKKRVASGK